MALENKHINMQKIQTIIFAICIISSINIQTNDAPQQFADDKQILSDSMKPDTIILFATEDNNHPSGEYWPSPKITVLGPNGKPINSSSAYIGDTGYSDISEEKILQPNQESHYLGYFIDVKSHETIYLYGIKDNKTSNDANEESDEDEDDNDDDN